MVQVFPDPQRGDYSRILQVIATKYGISPQEAATKFNIMPSVLKMGFAPNPTTSDYSVSPRKGVDTAAPPSSILLDQNDHFVVTGIGLRFSRSDFSSPSYSNHGKYPLLTYPDPAYFSYTGTAVGDEADSLQNVVNGLVNLKIGGLPVIENLLAQELCFNGDGTYTASPEALPRFGGSNGERGIFPIVPNYIIDASQDNQFGLTLANGPKLNIDGNISTGTTASTTRNWVYFICSGWKIKNFPTGELNVRSC